MKILYALQGTGNGHISRAFDVIPSLMRYGEVDILVSGSQNEIRLPWPVKYQVKGLGFIFGKNGGIDYHSTFEQLDTKTFIKEVRSVPVKSYNVIIHDFEPVTAYSCLFHQVSCIGLSHQNAVCGGKAPIPERADLIGSLILRRYAPATYSYGFHFEPYDKNTFTPIIRNEIRKAEKKKGNHYTVYLPSYGDSFLLDYLKQFPEFEFEVFSKHTKTYYSQKNIHIQPVHKDRFTTSMTGSAGVLCNAGFETPAEALFLGKKLCVIPMKGQYEQQCNAAALRKLGVAVLGSFTDKELPILKKWLADGPSLQIHYPDQTHDIIDMLMLRHAPGLYVSPYLAASDYYLG